MIDDGTVDGDSLYEVHMCKKVIKYTLPFTIGLVTYAYAKRHMAEWFYDCIIPNWDRKLYNLCCSDTDSFYFCLGVKSVDECVVEDKRENYMENVKPRWFVSNDKDKTPGLAKLEKSGESGVFLCAKSYVVLNEETGESQFKCKGVQKKNSDILTFENYRACYLAEPSFNDRGFNMGIRLFERKQIYSYIAEKCSLTRLYVKRNTVDPIEYGNTVPLDL